MKYELKGQTNNRKSINTHNHPISTKITNFVIFELVIYLYYASKQEISHSAMALRRILLGNP